MLADLDEQRRHGVKVYLATNQEHLHARFLMESIGLAQYCDGIFYSAALSCRKPNTHLYEKVTELSGFRPEQLLLIDDTPANVLAARDGRGRNGSCLPPPAQIRTCGTTAYGSCLGYVTRSDLQGKDVHFWV
ncbi:HAD-IA family hydrolase [Pseudomonas carnis]|uniref:HAD-IA family hydrolase n=1 Tax=Pseudomonas carnis TaxID=2487355 RepID=UPI00338E9F2A